MAVVPKKFQCSNCKNETYSDADECQKCKAVNAIKPIPKKLYRCYLNGTLYGAGNLTYMHELITDYLIKNSMYNKSKCDFKIVKD